MSYRYALAGNPNSGKTTLFNVITGSNQYVGNWPGVTVEKKEGKVIMGEAEATVVDLPGIYSLSPYSMEEIVTRNYIIDEKPDLIINIVDATNLERNLYLSLQLAELGRPMIIALNMMDALEKRGDSVDYKLLSSLLSIPVYPISASKSHGITKLMRAVEHEAIHATTNKHIDKHVASDNFSRVYDFPVQTVIEKIEKIIQPVCEEKNQPLRWSAVKLIDGDSVTNEKLDLKEEQRQEIDFHVKSLERENVDREMVIADQKYKFICRICKQAVKKKHPDDYITTSDRIDKVLTNKYLAIPIFLLIMLSIFFITFSAVGTTLTDLVDKLINQDFSGMAREFLVNAGASDWAVGLVCDGAIAGVGAVLQFFPQIFILFFFLSLLEDSGYMARAAFIMDRALHKIGLSGKSFVPMMMGFGCTVPAVMSCRTLENDKDRRLTIMMTPFMSCSAKMPVYSLFIASFFPSHKGLIVFALYILGMIIAIVSALILQKTVMKGGHAAFVMELPPYRLPTPKTLGIHLWQRIKDFFSKAGKILLAASMIIWVLQYFNFSFQHVTDSSESMLGIIGTAIAPIFAPLGFGQWQASVSLLSGLIARESIVSTLGILFGTGGEATTALVPILQGVFTPLSAFCFMVFALLFVPCIAAVSAIRSEMKSFKWTVGAIAYQACTAWLVTFVIYQVGSLILRFV